MRELAARTGLDLCRKGRIGGGTGTSWPVAEFSGLASRNAGVWVVVPLNAGQRGAPMAALRNPRSPSMTTKAIDKPAKSGRSAVARRTAVSKTASKRDLAATTTGSRKREAISEQHPVEGRVTKNAQILQLLNRPNGASIEEMIQATGWQQHSVRGFLAGTVKKKLGFTLTSSKSEAELRRYKIDTKRGR